MPVAASVIGPDRPAKPVRVIGQGNQERLAPLPEAFGAVFGFWLKDPLRGEYLFAPGQKPVSAPAARADRRGMLKQAGIDKKISPHQPHYTCATHRLDAGAERVDLQALLDPASVATTSMDLHVEPVRMEQGVARW